MNEKEGPTLPIPGPTFPTAEATALNEVIISIPKAVRKIEPITKTKRKVIGRSVTNTGMTNLCKDLTFQMPQ